MRTELEAVIEERDQLRARVRELEEAQGILIESLDRIEKVVDRAEHERAKADRYRAFR